MFETESGIRSERHPVISLIIILLIVGLGFIVVGPIIGFFVAIPFFEGSMVELSEAIQQPASHPELKIPLFIMQGSATLFGLILGPAWYLSVRQRSVLDFFKGKNTEGLPVLITAFTVIVFMAVNSVFIEWNSTFTFPDFARDFENWAREREDLATELTRFLTTFDSTAQVLIALIVIAVLPAIGEEIVFRGLIQNELYRGTKNIHVSIWVAAILFSAIHFQFFGFVPRMLLGALFGYLYYWSGNLTLAIIAHFVNNGISILALYFYQTGRFSFDLESPEAAPAHVIMISAVMTAGLLYYFFKYFENKKSALP